MSGDLTFLLDGSLITAPEDWEQITTDFGRDKSTRMISQSYDGTMTFTGSGYAYLDSRRIGFGNCNELSLQVFQLCEGQSKLIIDGYIILADCVWNEPSCRVECSVADNGIGRNIHNNRKIPISPLADLSKNDVGIPPVVPLDMIFHDVNDGTDIAGGRRMFDWLDAMRHAVSYMTDNSGGVVSSWYQSLPSDERYAIGIGAEIRTSGFSVPRISYTFDDLFMEVAKKHNLWVFPERGPTGNITLRIEPEEYFYDSSVAFDVLYIDGLKRSVNEDELYASVKVGSKEAIKELQVSHGLPYIVLLAFAEEAFHFSGICNTDAELNLMSEWIIDTNVIQDTVGGDDKYDDEMFIVQYDRNTAKTTQGTYLYAGAAPFLYNEQLLNVNVLKRYALPSSVGANYGPTSDDSFLAERGLYPDDPGEQRSGNVLVSDPPGRFFHSKARFADDFTPPNFDQSDRWGLGTPGLPVSLDDSRYYPSVQGLYIFETQFWGGIGTTYPLPAFPYISLYPGVQLGMSAAVFSSGGVQIGPIQYQVHPTTYYLVGNHTLNFSFSLSLQPGQYVEFYYDAYLVSAQTNTWLGAPYGPSPGAGSTPGRSTVNVGWRSYAKVTKVINGGVLVPASPARDTIFEFSRAMPSSQWETVTTRPELGVVIDGSRLTHVNHITRNIATGETQWKLNR